MRVRGYVFVFVRNSDHVFTDTSTKNPSPPNLFEQPAKKGWTNVGALWLRVRSAVW
jgi:hypothetical protein